LTYYLNLANFWLKALSAIDFGAVHVSRRYTAASFTKNFSWHKSFKRLHSAIANGFSGEYMAVPRDVWRQQSRIPDSNRQLIPMNFFLYSRQGVGDDYILVDALVETAIDRPYSQEFARLSLFAFHLANSGSWRNSKWPDGRVAGWANEFIRDVAWKGGLWSDGAFRERSLQNFIRSRIKGQPFTRRKILTNYRYMLTSASILLDGTLQPVNFRQRWFVDAVQLFWDREIFDGALPIGAGERAYEDLISKHEVHKLLGCDENQGRAFARAAFREYSKATITRRFSQLQRLRHQGVIAA
jgi:hypothetical protein